MTLAELVAELKAARTAWHEDGVPISETYAQFLDAIGNLTDEVERAIAESQVPRIKYTRHAGSHRPARSKF